MKLNIGRIKELIKENPYGLRVLLRQLDLIKLVNDNCTHIQQLETLVTSLEGGLPPYYKEYQPEEEYIVQQAAIIARRTLNNRGTNYADPELDVDYFLTYFRGLNDELEGKS